VFECGTASYPSAVPQARYSKRTRVGCRRPKAPGEPLCPGACPCSANNHDAGKLRTDHARSSAHAACFPGWCRRRHRQFDENLRGPNRRELITVNSTAPPGAVMRQGAHGWGSVTASTEEPDAWSAVQFGRALRRFATLGSVRRRDDDSFVMQMHRQNCTNIFTYF
jgi:hypothetical protein